VAKAEIEVMGASDRTFAALGAPPRTCSELIVLCAAAPNLASFAQRRLSTPANPIPSNPNPSVAKALY
jgi:hypothetical protein